MARDTDQFDLFVSYARADDAGGWISGFVEALLAEHRRFTGGRVLVPFFDRQAIRGLDDWQHRIHHGLAASRLFLAFISPRYFASEWCRREWRAWIDTEIAKHILSAGVAPIYIVEVPGLYSGMSEQEVAHRVADLCGLPPPHDAFIGSASPVVWAVRRRQANAVEPFYNRGVEALREADLRKVLAGLARDLDARAEDVRRAALSESTVPPYNRMFSGRIELLLDLRQRLLDDRAGVITSIQGLGGIGKSELAFTYAQAYASVYPGGRFLVPCEGRTSLREAVLCLGDAPAFRGQISDEDRKTVDTYFAAVRSCLDERLARLGHILLVLDNVTEPAILTRPETAHLTCLGPGLHLLGTTRLPAPPAEERGWLVLGELRDPEALELMEKYRPFANESEREAARSIVRRLGGFTLAVELVAAYLYAHPDTTCAAMADGLGLKDLDGIAEDGDVKVQYHNNELRLGAVLGPVIGGLTAPQRRTLEYAAFLHPDQVPLPWLQALVARDFPEIGERQGRLDPWAECWRRLLRLALFSRAAGEDARPRIVRVHRLVQDLIQRELSDADRAARHSAVDQLARERDAVLRKTTNWQEARWELEPFDALARLWDETGHPSAAWLLNQAGHWWDNLAQYTRAEPLMRRALAIDEASFGTEHPSVAIRLNNLAQLLQATNRLSEAEPLMRRVVAIFEASLGSDHPNVATALNNLAQLLQATNRLAEAEPLMRRALAIDEASFGPEHPSVAIRLNNLAQLLKATNRLSEAEPLMRRALAIDEASFGTEHPEVATDLNNLAALLKATNRLSEAEPLMRRALAIDEASFGPDHPKVAIRLNNLAQLLKAKNRLSEAEPLMRRALEIMLRFRVATGHVHPNEPVITENYRLLLAAMGRSEEEVLAQIKAVAEPFGVRFGE
ncbi:MAG TPA: toll/interleukin-1 receptor domain-containing protein [Planctomycetota bacterium]|nr:toll/interleukin-1 receptor domain-containing protein [Planctomycetota bacterium]